MISTLLSEQRTVLGIERVLLSLLGGLIVQMYVWAPPSVNADSLLCFWWLGHLHIFNRVDTGVPTLLESTGHQNERKLKF